MAIKIKSIKLYFKVILVIVGVFSALIISEIVCRYSWDNIDRSINLEPFTSKENAQGFRVTEEDIIFKNEAEGYFRIICLGDSFTLGHGVKDNETYPFYLEEYLNKKCKKKFQVLNAGICGATITEELAKYKEANNLVQHKLVILLVSPPDIVEEMAERVKGFNPEFDRIDSIFKSLKICCFLKHIYRQQMKILLDKYMRTEWANNFVSQVADNYFTYLKELRDIVKLNNRQFVIVIYCDFDYLERFEVFCKKEDVRLINITDEYNKEAEKINLKLVYHHNKQGNSVLARLIADKLISQNLVN